MKKYALYFLFFACFHISISAQITSKSEVFQMDVDRGCKTERLKLPRAHNESIILDSIKAIEGLALSGSVILSHKNSFARIILQDKDEKEYVVLETNRIYNDVDTMLLYDYCEETKYLPNVYPCILRIYTNNASVNISSITSLYSKNQLSEANGYKVANLKNLSKTSKKKQAEIIAENININNKKHKRLWRAEATDLSLMPWEDKKRIMGLDGSCFPTGFEYFSSGIFEIGEADVEVGRALSPTSPYVDSFDWRNRHGINWMTSVKHQGTGNSCWAFAPVGVTEALVNLYFNSKIDYNLSEQEVISCSGCGNNSSGGYAEDALNWISYHGVSEELAFPFSDSDEPCGNKINYEELITMNDASSVLNHTTNNNDSVKKALIKYGPLLSGFMYNNGTFHGHAMALAGYATLHEGDTIRYFGSYNQNPNNFDVIPSGDIRIGKTYWIFKNSYGTNRYYEHKGYAYVLFNDQLCFRTPYYAKMPVASQIYDDTNIAITDNDGDGYYFWGLGPKPSHCPSWVSDIPDGDDSNINYGELDQYGNLQELPSGITIKTPLTYATNTTTSYRIGIVSGGKLTISGTTSLTGNGKIRVCEGGILEIDGGILQNAVLELIPGGQVVVKNNGQIKMAIGEEFNAPQGVIVNIESGYIG